MPSVLSRVDRLAAHRHVFASDWHLRAEFSTAFQVLKDLWSYPRWWPAFRKAEQVTDNSGHFALRGVLPITLNFTLERDIEDQTSGVLRAIASGDISGTVEWKLTSNCSGGTTAHFSQVVTLNHRLARRADRILRPALVWNHAAAMRSGHSGMKRYLANM